MERVKSKYSMEDIIVPYDEVLHNKTMNYWNISRAWNGFGDSYTVSDCLLRINEITKELNPNRKLWVRAIQIQQDVISYGTKRGMLKKVSVIPTACKVLYLKTN